VIPQSARLWKTTTLRSCGSWTNVWMQKSTTCPQTVMLPPLSEMQHFTNHYLSYDKKHNIIRQSICKDDILENFDPYFSPKLLKSMLFSTSNGIHFAMRLREDIMVLKRKTSDHSLTGELRSLDAVLKEFLGSTFCRNILSHQRITFENSSGIVLEKVAEAEAVHKIRALSELKRRLSAKGRRCFALFHPW
jgi:hypothetical protein